MGNLVRTFFYGLQTQKSEEDELNKFLAEKDIVVKKIFQSAASCSSALDKPDLIDVGVAITIVYQKKKDKDLIFGSEEFDEIINDLMKACEGWREGNVSWDIYWATILRLKAKKLGISIEKKDDKRDN
jgi:hypothetical protein